MVKLKPGQTMSFYYLIVLDESEMEPFKYVCFTKDIKASIKRLEERGYNLKVIFYKEVEARELRETMLMIVD